MSVEQARALMAKAVGDADFRASLEAAPAEQRRAILAEHGFGDVRLTHLAQVAPVSAGGELSDEEFAAVAGGGGSTTTLLALGGADVVMGALAATAAAASAA